MYIYIYNILYIYIYIYIEASFRQALISNYTTSSTCSCNWSCCMPPAVLFPFSTKVYSYCLTPSHPHVACCRPVTLASVKPWTLFIRCNCLLQASNMACNHLFGRGLRIQHVDIEKNTTFLAQAVLVFQL